VLVLLDRDEDLPVLFHHPWTYQALIDDVLGIGLNRTHVPVRALYPLPTRADLGGGCRRRRRAARP
jgi:hypothetical protein